MTLILRNSPITGYRWGAGTVVDGAFIENCEIFACRLDLPPNPRQRPVFRNINWVDNVVSSMFFDGAIIEDAVIDGVRTTTDRDLLIVGGCAFRHVILRGNLASINILDKVDGRWGVNVREAYQMANIHYWNTLRQEEDWALDISGISGRFSIRGIPSAVIRRNPEIQVVMTFDQALLGEWQSVSGIMDSTIRANIDLLLKNGWRDVILMTHPQWPDFTRDIAILRELQRRDAALPD